MHDGSVSIFLLLADRIEEADVHTQTDAFLDRPPTPLFIPAKTGLDAATQIGEAEVSTNTTIIGNPPLCGVLIVW